MLMPTNRSMQPFCEIKFAFALMDILSDAFYNKIVARIVLYEMYKK